MIKLVIFFSYISGKINHEKNLSSKRQNNDKRWKPNTSEPFDIKYEVRYIKEKDAGQSLAAPSEKEIQH